MPAWNGVAEPGRPMGPSLAPVGGVLRGSGAILALRLRAFGGADGGAGVEGGIDDGLQVLHWGLSYSF